MHFAYNEWTVNIDLVNFDKRWWEWREKSAIRTNQNTHNLDNRQCFTSAFRYNSSICMIRAVAMEKRLRLNAGKFPHSEAEQTARNRVVFALIACIIVQLWQKKHVFFAATRSPLFGLSCFSFTHRKLASDCENVGVNSQTPREISFASKNITTTKHNYQPMFTSTNRWLWYCFQ